MAGDDAISEENFGLKSLLNPLHPARVLPGKRTRSEFGLVQDKPASTRAAQFYDEGLGIYLKPVTHTIMDVEDLIYNT